MARKKKPEKAAGDPFKSYVIVMTLLVLVMAVLYFVIDGTRDEYAQANQRIQRYLTSNRTTSTGSPASIPDLAYEVEKLAKTYAEAAGGTGLTRRISQEQMKTAATKAGVAQVYAGREQEDREGNYETVSQKFDYEAIGGGPTEIWRLLILMYNIEALGRYRVSEVNWEVAPVTDQAPGEPLDKIKKTTITVALRGPITAE